MSIILTVFIALLFLKLGVSIALDAINLRHVKRLSGEVPEAFRDFVDEEGYAKSVEYTVAKTKFGMVNDAFDALVLAVVLLSGFLPWIYGLLSGVLGEGIWGQGAVLLSVLLLLAIPDLPFGWWGTFRLEERFGFNKSTQRLWIIDKLKGVALSFAIGLPLIAFLLFLVRQMGEIWWIWGFVVFFGFQIIMVVAYPMFIMPLFNKLEPMEPGGLKDRLFALAERTGFRAKTILVMDGSRRSAHSNAFFAGFGRFRRIVLFDTLIGQLSEDELEAVLAHEIGHYKLGHIPKMVGLSALMTLGSFWLMGYLAAEPAFIGAFGFSETIVSIVPVFLLFMLLSGIVGFWLSPLTSLLSRKHEYEADAFAKDAMSGPRPLVGALRKLHKENLSNLTPHPLYSTFHYSHPTLLEREASLSS